jgi:hypothetical protein
MREFRDTILIDNDGKPMAYDIDIVNCAPTLILRWLDTQKQKNICDRTPIQRYLDDRDNLLNEMIETMDDIKDRCDAKTRVIAVTYGKEPGDNATTWLNEYAEATYECAEVAAYAKDNRHIMDHKRKNSPKGSNLAYGVFAIVIQELEHQCMSKAVEFFTMSADFVPMALIFDGFLLKAQPDVDLISSDLLRRCSSYVFDTTGLRVEFAQKKIEHAIPLPDYRPPYPRPEGLGVAKRYEVNNDMDGARAMIDHHESEIAYDGENFYAKSDGLWAIKSDQAMTNWFQCRVPHAPLYTLDKQGDETNEPFQFVPKHRSIAQATIGEYRFSHVDVKFPQKLALSGRGKLLFKNGYIDMKESPIVLRPESNDLFFHCRIDCDYTMEEDEYDSEITRRIFNPIFGTSDSDKANSECWKTYVSRGFACDIDEKRWAIMVGARFCGYVFHNTECCQCNPVCQINTILILSFTCRKGVLCEALKNAFDGYYGTFSANNMKVVKGSGSVDAELALKFAIDFDKHHFVCSNELKMEKKHGQVLDGNIAKMLASGGDSVSIRALYNMARDIVPISRMMICANDIPEIEPTDSKETLLIFRMKAVFVATAADLEGSDKERCKKADSVRYQIGDPGIKAFCKEPGFKMAFIRHILKAYQPHTDYLTDDVFDASTDYKEYEDDTESFLNCFVYTDDDSHRVKKKEVSALIKERFPDMSLETASQALAKFGSPYAQSSNAKLSKDERATGFRRIVMKSIEEIDAYFQ